jgi:quercetin dioxygenase-like cupin family protein
MTTPAAGEGAPLPRFLCDTAALAAQDDAPAGALWKLAEAGRQLDANVVRLPPAARVAPHTEPDLDVLLLVLGGEGTLLGADEPVPLRAGGLAWLPHGAARGVEAGERGLTYLTAHRRRPGLRIRSAAEAERLGPAPRAPEGPSGAS